MDSISRARTKKDIPVPSRKPGQKSVDDPLYLYRRGYPIPFTQPEYIQAAGWRRAINSQPVCVAARDYLIASILALEWKIEAIDSNKRDELKSEVQYYTRKITQSSDGDYVTLVEWVLGDCLDLPFGGALEMGKQSETGRLLWYRLLDGATCFPTQNEDFPVGQRYLDQQVVFPRSSINRIYWTPNSSLVKRGWGMPPPMRIYLALEMLVRGDTYYSKLLEDTPPTGILDLGDMSKESAESWIIGWQTLMSGIDPYKIPVLYEHENPISWIDFTRNPGEIMYDQAIARYTALVCGGYGVSPSDISLGGDGSGNGGQTLAGTIRGERVTRKNGVTRAKLRVKAFFDRMLPDYLRFTWVNSDAEDSVAISRARLASATAYSAYISNKVFTPQEMRLQAIADGMVTIPLPEKIPDDADFPNDNKFAERPSMLGRPISPEEGGHGEVGKERAKYDDEIDKKFRSLDKTTIRRLMYRVYPIIWAEVAGAKESLQGNLFLVWRNQYDRFVWGESGESDPLQTGSSGESSVNQILLEIGHLISVPDIWEDVLSSLYEYAENLRNVELNKLREQCYIRGWPVSEDSEISINRSDFYKQVGGILSKIPLYVSRAIVSATRDIAVFDDTNIGPERIVEDEEPYLTACSYIEVAKQRMFAEIGQKLFDIIEDKLKGVIEHGKDNGKTTGD